MVDAAAPRSSESSGLGRVWRRCVAMLHAATGESRYANYVAHARRAHPESEPLSERDFWRRMYANQDRSPEGRCC